MDQIISHYQSAFIGNGFTMDGVVILNEDVTEAKKRKMERLIFKIDFAKAYDTSRFGVPKFDDEIFQF